MWEFPNAGLYRFNNATCINQAAARVRIDGEGVPEVRLHQLEHLHGKLHSCQCHAQK